MTSRRCSSECQRWAPRRRPPTHERSDRGAQQRHSTRRHSGHSVELGHRSPEHGRAVKPSQPARYQPPQDSLRVPLAESRTPSARRLASDPPPFSLLAHLSFPAERFASIPSSSRGELPARRVPPRLYIKTGPLNLDRFPRVDQRTLCLCDVLHLHCDRGVPARETVAAASVDVRLLSPASSSSGVCSVRVCVLRRLPPVAQPQDYGRLQSRERRTLKRGSYLPFPKHSANLLR